MMVPCVAPFFSLFSTLSVLPVYLVCCGEEGGVGGEKDGKKGKDNALPPNTSPTNKKGAK